jgi:hypothetical protein
MYDVLGANHCTGNVTVEATGFNVTCRYLTDFSFKYNFTDQFWLMMSGQPIPRWIVQGPGSLQSRATFTSDAPVGRTSGCHLGQRASQGHFIL